MSFKLYVQEGILELSVDMGDNCGPVPYYLRGSDLDPFDHGCSDLKLVTWVL
jgi:hypothetical protein